MLRFPISEYEAIRRHGEETYPHECCGILLGMSEGETRSVQATVRCGNTRIDSPQNRYNIDPREIIRAQREAQEHGLEIVGFYHSHPDHPARWSQTDFEEAHWIGCSYVITSVENGRAMVTNSFVLAGGTEEDKWLEDEEVILARG
jgi:proteasome lid subunit RPN8/RPN11